VPSLSETVPDFDLLLAMQPHELAAVLLPLSVGHLQHGMFQPDGVGKGYSGGRAYVTYGYDGRDERLIERVLAEGWAWLVAQGLVLPAPGTNGNNGFKILSRNGEKLAQDKRQLEQYRAQAEFPKAMLYPQIAERVYAALARSDFDEAVFSAFKAVEIAA
jgi:hypothetical protein